MRLQPFLFAVAVIGGVFVMIPRPDGTVEAGAPEQRYTSSSSPWSKNPSRQAARAQATSEWYGGEISLPREPDGHFYADVLVEGSRGRMMVDTGASVIALTGEDARAMGVDWNESDVRPVARGANGDVLGVPVTLDSVALGDLELHGVEAIVVPEGLAISLLGQSFLGRVKRVEIQGDKMVLAS